MRPVYKSERSDPFPPLLERFEHDIEAQKEVYELLRIYLKKMCAKWLKSMPNETLDDLVHDVVSHILMKLNQFHGKSRFGTWAFTVGSNYCSVKVKKIKVRAKIAVIVPISSKTIRTYTGNRVVFPSELLKLNLTGGRHPRVHCVKGHLIEQRGKKRFCRICKQAKERERYQQNKEKV